MEGLVGLSLACNIVQIVDFGLKIVSKSREIHRDGKTIEEKDYLANARELAYLGQRLRGSINDAGRRTNLPPDDKSLYDLGERCHSTALELISELQKAAQGPGGGLKSSVYHALKSLRRSGKIREIDQRLLRYKNLLDSGILVQLFHRSKEIALESGDRFLLLDSNLQKFIGGITQGFSKTDDLLKREVRYMYDSVATDGNSTRDHVTVVGAKITEELRDLRIGDNIQKQRDAVLQSLVFPEINLRQEQIADAYRNTYEWIFSETEKGVIQDELSEEPHPWYSFVRWLRSKNASMYWIYGRAGAGKSTLMNFIYSDSRTRKHLSENSTANSGQYILTAFFFWKPGNVMQKSVRGLLQSLLYQIFSEDKNALASAVPSLSTAQKSPPYLAWSSSRLARLLRSTLDSLSRPLFILLDGIDEFDENEEDLLDTIQSLQAYPNVKMCISSRPLHGFESRFGHCPRLRLQDLTREDLRVFVTETLFRSPSFTRMNETHPRDMAGIIDSILWLAHGGFLWANLVVKDIIKGLDNKDSIEILAERIESMPPEIDDIYARMWDRYQTDLKYYKEEAMLYFRMILRAEMSLLDFTILTDNDLQRRILNDNMSDENSAFIVDRCKDRRIHVLARGAGLLEVGETVRARGLGYITFASAEDNPLAKMHNSWTVRLSHRTVADFLERKMRHTMETNVINDLKARLRSHCMLWLIVPVNTEPFSVSTECWWIERVIEVFVPDKQKWSQLLPAIYDVLQFVEETNSRALTRLSSDNMSEGHCSASWTVGFLGNLLKRVDPIGPLYVHRRLENGGSMNLEALTALLYFATGASITPAMSQLIRYLLAMGANPMAISKGNYGNFRDDRNRTSAWQQWIIRLWTCFPTYLKMERSEILLTAKSFGQSCVDLTRCMPLTLEVNLRKRQPKFHWGGLINPTNFETTCMLLVKTNAATLFRRMLRSHDFISPLNEDLGLNGVMDCLEPVIMYMGACKILTSKEDSDYLMMLIENAFWETELSSLMLTGNLASVDPILLDDLFEEFGSLMTAKDVAKGPHVQKLAEELPKIFDKSLPSTRDRTHATDTHDRRFLAPDLDNVPLDEIKWPTSITYDDSTSARDPEQVLSEPSSWVREAMSELSSAMSSPDDEHDRSHSP